MSGDYSVNGYDGRLDHTFNDSNKFFFRATQKNLNDSGTDRSSSYNPLLGALSAVTTATNLAGSYNWIVSPNVINEFRAGYTAAEYVTTYPQAAQGDSIMKTIGINGLPGAPLNGLGGVPDFSIGNFLGGDSNSVGRPRDIKNFIYQFSDNLTWVAGQHTIKLGLDWRKLKYQDQTTFTNGDEYGDYNFTGVFTGGASPTDANAFADFLLGIATNTDYARNGPDGKPFAYHVGGFLQDDWKARRNFSVSFGLRYELNPPFDDKTSQLGQFDRNYPGGRLIVQGQQGLALVNPFWRAAVGNTPFVTNDAVGLPRSLRKVYYGNIQPRLGLTWSPFSNNRTIVRASSGFYSVPMLGAVLYSLLGVDTSYFIGYASAATAPLILPNAFGGAALDNSALGYPGYRRANQIDLRDPRVIQWNFSINQDLGWKTLLRVSYTGSHTTGLIYSPDLNQLRPNTVGYSALTATPALRQQNLKFPNFGEVLTRDNGPSAKYQSGTIELSRRFARDLTFQNSYTLAFNRSNAFGSAPYSLGPNGEGGTGRGDNGENVLNYYDIKSDYGDVAFTRRHRFVGVFLYDLPTGRGKRYLGNIGRGADALLRRMEIDRDHASTIGPLPDAHL